ncbi:MAG: glycosyltransferase [Lachnospiraceae bacterium]
MSPKVNVIVPVYNVAPYLSKFFESLLGQTFQDFDVWVVNDKSTDDSLDIIEYFSDKFSGRMHIINNAVNLGLCATRNVGLDCCNSQGEYILMLDSDDYIDCRFIEKMVYYADQYHADITICGLERFDDKTDKIVCTEMVNNPEQIITDIKDFALFGYMNPVVWNKLFRRTVIADIRFTTIKRSEDTVFLFSILPNVNSIKFINEVLYHYRLRDASLSGAITDEIYESMLEGFKEAKDFFARDKKYSDYMELFVVQMFIRCGIGGACRLSFRNMRKAPFYVNKTGRFMDDAFPEWRSNKYLTLSCLQKKSIYACAVCCAALLYKCHLFLLAVYFYWFMSSICKKDYRA